MNISCRRSQTVLQCTIATKKLGLEIFFLGFTKKNNFRVEVEIM